MTVTRPALHGRDHRPNGADPIMELFPARMPWVLMQGNLNGVTVPSGSDYYPEMTGLLVSPLNAGGTVDSDVYGAIQPDDTEVDVETGGSSNEPFKALKIRQPGLYRIEVLFGWFEDWGPVRVDLDITGEPSGGPAFGGILTFSGTLLEQINRWYASGVGANQISLRLFNHLAVDERATDTEIKVFVNQSSGSSRTFNNTDRVGGMTLSIIRLSSSGHSNPPL